MLLARFNGWMVAKEAAMLARQIDQLIDGGPWEQTEQQKRIIFWAQGWQVMYSNGAIKAAPGMPAPKCLFDLMLGFLANELGRAAAHVPALADVTIDTTWKELGAGIIIARTHSESAVMEALKLREIRRASLLAEERLTTRR